MGEGEARLLQWSAQGVERSNLIVIYSRNTARYEQELLKDA